MIKRKGITNCKLLDMISFSKRKKIKLASTPFILLLVLLCPWHLSSSMLSEGYLIQDVPFFPQERYQCGPASLAGVLNFWGIQISPSQIAEDVFSKSAKGTLGIDLALYARGKGLFAEAKWGSFEELKKSIEKGYPTIVLVDQGPLFIQANHFMVVVGYKEDEVIVNSGRKKETHLKNKKFLKTWKKNHFWMLLVKPSENR